MPQEKTEKNLWIEEIIRETDHYYQGEAQHDQRASWLLTTSGALITLLVGLQLAAQEKGYNLPIVYIVAAVTSFFLSSLSAVIVVIPLLGTKSFFNDVFGYNLRKNKNLTVEELITKKFRNEKWSRSNYEKRIMFHFRTHFIRSNKKALGVLWSSVFLIAGLIFSAILAISIAVSQ